MAGKGHEDQFASHTLSARCWIRKETIAGGSGNDEVAAIDALAGGAVQLPGSIPLQAYTEVFLAGRANRRIARG